MNLSLWMSFSKEHLTLQGETPNFFPVHLENTLRAEALQATLRTYNFLKLKSDTESDFSGRKGNTCHAANRMYAPFSNIGRCILNENVQKIEGDVHDTTDIFAPSI